jgi:hypothetical protein
MSDQSLAQLLPAIGMAVFARTEGGAFASLAPPPHWFARLLGDKTFPFLGHILEEATVFWQAGAPGLREWGPCAELDESGREFHFMVAAVTVAGAQYLVFRQDAAADRTRDVLQKAREQALAIDDHARMQAALGTEARRIGGDIHHLLDRVQATSPASDPDILAALSARCDDLMAVVGRLVHAPARG